ncbi:MAG: ABC transporter ATP-binding protein [Spirochaetes bacterium]|nr:ABC transporter ATP-binding protein [Spirochaetota bacterium]
MNKKIKSQPAIEVDQLNFSYQHRLVLQKIQLQAEAGKICTFIGPNGSGKTTLLKNIARILHPFKKTVYINGQEIHSFVLKNLAKKLAYVPQEYHLDIDFSVRDIVLMGRYPYQKRFSQVSKQDQELVDKALELTNTSQLAQRNIKNLSGGEKQRVVIARAIAQDTEIILLDEPISHLDIHHQIEIMETIRMLNEKSQITILLVLHDLNLALNYSDYVVLLNGGKIVDDGTAEEVIQPDNIKKVYQIDSILTTNPRTGKPFLIPLGKVD